MTVEMAHILVVEDDPYLSDMIKNTLEAEGYTVTVAHDGEAAIKSLREQETDLALLDILLPGSDGYDILKKIRKSSEMPVIMLTGVQETSALAKSLELGADDYIRKPFLPHELTARIRAKLRRYTK